MSNSQITIPISLYIHIPWCAKKCPYCDFNSYATPHAGMAEKEYIKRLLDDWQQNSLHLQQRKLHSIFIGGGTPSLFCASSYAVLFEHIQPFIDKNTTIEITLEANPGSSEQQRFADYRDIGINRLSLGIQSVDNHQLQQLGRIHNSMEAQQAFAMAQQAGFTNINVDLMFALPQQTVTSALTDLRTVIAWQPSHISWYQLTIEPNTHFYKYPPILPNDEQAWKMQLEGQELLARAGYQHYEVSAYSQPGQYCQHNLNYWRYGDYLGIGAGAHSKLTDLTNGTIRRSWCWRNPRDYLDKNRNTIAEITAVPQEQLLLEFMLNALRLQQPIPVELLQQRTGLQLDACQSALKQAQALELLTIEHQHFVVSDRGKRYLNNLLELFL